MFFVRISVFDILGVLVLSRDVLLRKKAFFWVLSKLISRTGGRGRGGPCPKKFYNLSKLRGGVGVGGKCNLDKIQNKTFFLRRTFLTV